MKQRDSFELRHTIRLSARITVQTAARCELTRADAFTRSREQLSSAVRSSQCETLEFSEEHNEPVRRLFSLHVALIY